MEVNGSCSLQWVFLRPSGPYDTERDVIFYYHDHIAVSSLVMEPGSIAVFYPHDGHLPGIALAGEKAGVKKVVVKVACELLK